jgi:hypothetical protein
MDLGASIMTCLVVYYLDGKWYGEEATYKRSGSGFYREFTRIEVPQSKAEIEKFAAEHRYKIGCLAAVAATLDRQIRIPASAFAR